MSGFIVGYGAPKRQDVEAMFLKIQHRGPHLSGIEERGKILLAQNYLNADVPGTDSDAAVPVATGAGKSRSIAYDGQIGNRRDLGRRFDVEEGPFMEERILLRMFELYGPDMFAQLEDAIFSFVISDGTGVLAARDLLGIKTLFYGKRDDSLFLTSELKSLTGLVDEIHEFPPGHYMDRTGEFRPYDQLRSPTDAPIQDAKKAVKDIREIIERSVRNRVDFQRPTGALLSGGLDSSIICSLTANLHREVFGDVEKLRTFSIGVGESGDILSAREVSGHLGTDHYELIVGLEEILEALPDVIYHLESFDPSLVRSAVSNYLISRFARHEGVEILLSGEGGDEIFCGYTYLKDVPEEEIPAQQIRCLGFLHNNASLRLDRMNQCHSIRVVAPLVSGELLHYALGLAPGLKIKLEGEKKIEKWILRKAFEADLPGSVVWRGKQEFSQGSGSADLLPAYFEDIVGDGEFAEAQEKYPILRSKEELHYFQIFTERFGAGAIDTVGQWICI